MYDRDIREPLFEFLEEYYGKVRILEEKRMGRSRADVVMILSDAVCGLEIKSDADTYARLSRQVRDYDQYCDCNYIVAGTRHAHHVAEHVPKWWGIITVELEEGKPDFYMLRKPQQNPKVDWQKKMIEKILLKVPKDKLYLQISQELFERDYTKIAEEIRAYRKEKQEQGKFRKKSGNKNNRNVK